MSEAAQKKLMPGEELDRLIAERVMKLVPCDGWKPFSFGAAGGFTLRKECSHLDTCGVRVSLRDEPSGSGSGSSGRTLT